MDAEGGSREGPWFRALLAVEQFFRAVWWMEGIRLEPGPVEATSQRAEGWGSWILPDTALHSCSNASEPASSTLGNAIIVRPT